MDRVHVECRPSGLRDPQEVREERQQEAEECENKLEQRETTPVLLI